MSRRTRIATRLMLREQARRPLLVILLVTLPFFFITRAIAATDRDPRRIGLPGGGEIVTDMQALHGASMVAITIAFLAGLCGAFIMRSARASDRRLVVAGFTPGEALAARVAVLGAVTLLAVAVSLAVTALSFDPASWPWFVTGNLLVGLLYAAAGALAGALLGQLGATYTLLFAAMLGMGILQNPMFGDGTPDGAALLAPDYGAGRVLIDGAFGAGFAAWGALALGVAWSALAVVAVAWLLRRSLAPTLNLKGVHMGPRARPLTLLLLVLTVGVVLLLVSGCGDDEPPATSKPVGNNADAVFARDMIPHHEDAIEMAEIAKQRAEHSEIRALADDIIAAQRSEIAVLEGISSDLGATGDDEHDGRSEHDMGMDGDMSELESAKPFDKAFVELMIPHHEGAVRMAEEELASGKHPRLRELARAIIKAQRREIDQMRHWSQEWYGEPAEESDHSSMDAMP